MPEFFKPNACTIGEIFTNDNSLYKVPNYQRPYRWETEQVEKLWDDIYSAHTNNETNYFMGSIITSTTRSSEYYDVVDGQQRLTTLIILFCVVRDLYPNINAQNIQNPKSVNINKIRNSIFYNYNENFSRLSLYTHAEHQNDFKNYIINEKATINLTKPTQEEMTINTEPKYKFFNTASLLSSKLKELGENDSGKLLDYLFNNVYIIRIDCDSTNFAVKLFQILNNRGMDLSNTDLIKSDLMGKIAEKDIDNEAKLQNENSFIRDWTRIEQIISYMSDDITLDDFFVIYEYYLLGSNPRDSLFQELQNSFKSKDPNEIVHDIKETALLYQNDIYDSYDKNLYSFWYLRWSIYWKSILITAKRTNCDNYKRLVFLLRKYYYLNWIAGKTLNAVKQTSFNIIKWLKEGQSIEAIESKLNSKMNDDDIINTVLSNLQKDVYNTRWLKPLLLLIEYNQDDSINERPFIETSNSLHVEHILPTEYSKFSEWNHIDKTFANEWLNRAGNLTLLSGTKNIEASNNPFKVKLNIYKGKGKYDDKNTKITKFDITKLIVDKYQDWTKETIFDRWNWFCNEVSELFEINTDSIKN